MITTKDLWFTLTKDGKKAKLVECLQTLYDIDNRKHVLSGAYEQGRLANVKKDLETFLINTGEWESNKQLQQKQQLR